MYGFGLHMQYNHTALKMWFYIFGHCPIVKIENLWEATSMTIVHRSHYTPHITGRFFALQSVKSQFITVQHGFYHCTHISGCYPTTMAPLLSWSA